MAHAAACEGLVDLVATYSLTCSLTCSLTYSCEGLVDLIAPVRHQLVLELELQEVVGLRRNSAGNAGRVGNRTRALKPGLERQTCIARAAAATRATSAPPPHAPPNRASVTTLRASMTTSHSTNQTPKDIYIQPEPSGVVGERP